MVEEITIQELAQMEPSACQIIDMRDETAFALGHIDGAVLIPQKELETSHGELPRDKMLVIYCRSGILSADVAEQLRDEGYQAVNLVGGYVQWLQNKIRRETKNEKAAEVEQGLRKKFHRVIFSRFAKAIKTYDLIQPNDRIAVCISGGKDSMLLAKCMQHLQKYSDFHFDVEYIVMDPGYVGNNRAKIIENAEIMDIPIRIYDSPIFETVYAAEGGSPCYLCARMRRGYLYKFAQDLGCNKIALGHHFDDAIETTLMSMLYGAEIKTMMPKLKSTNYEGMELIRPLYMVREKDIISWARYNELEFIRCACKVTRANEEADNGSKRQEVKMLIKKLKEENDNVDMNIFKSVHNVNLATIIGYRDCDGGELHSFTESYDK